MNFDIKYKDVLDYALAMQDINDIALPIATQYTLNDVVEDVKRNTLDITTNKMFDIKRKTFFRANSGFKKHNAKEFGYNINKLSAEVGITKSTKPHDKATEQVGNQQTAKNIDRSINPLGTKPLTKSVINLLEQKPLIYDSSINYRATTKRTVYLSRIFQANSENRGLIMSNGKRGTLYQIKSIKERNPTKRNPNQYKITKKPIASYIKDGQVKLKKKNSFLLDAMEMSANNVQKFFIKNAQIQFQRAAKRRGLK